MKEKEENKQRGISGMNQNPDPEMASYLIKKGLNDNEIREYENLRSFLHTNYVSNEYSFGPYFSEGVSARLLQLSKSNLLLDFAEDLSKFFTRVATLAFFILIGMLIYTYITHGNISGVIDIDPEKLNDTRLISSILYN